MKYPWGLAVFVYLLAALFLLYEMALQVSPSIMTNQLMNTFAIGARSLGITVAFYFYSYTFMQIPVGLLYDRFGPRSLITIAALLCACGAFFFGFAESLTALALGRFLMGIGSAFAFIGVLVVATRWFPAYYFAFLVGVAQLLAALGALGGELPLAAFVNVFGWRAVMFASGVIGIILALSNAMIMRDHPFEEIRPKIHSRHLLKDLKKIFRSSQTWWIALYAFSGWGPITVFAALWGVPFLMEKYQITNTKAALAIAMIWLGIGCTSPFIGWLSDRIRRRRILIMLCSAIGLVCSVFSIYTPIPFWLNLIFLLGVGIAASGQILSFALVKDNNRHSVMATAIGLNNMAVVIGGALLQPLVGFVLHELWNGDILNNVPVYSTATYQVALVSVPLCFLLGLLVSQFFIQETHCRSRYDDYSDVVS